MVAPMGESSVTQEKRASRWRTRLAAGIGGLAAAAASTAYAVYEARNPETTPQIERGRTIEAGRWLVTLRSARAAETTPDGRKPLRGAYAVMLELDLENRTAESSGVLHDVVTLLDPPAGVEARPMVFLKRDAALAGALQPRLRETLVAAWGFPEGAPRPAEIRVAIRGWSFKPKDNLYGAPGWFNPRVVGEARIPLMDPVK